MACKQNLDLRCVLISDPSTLGAGATSRLESRIKKCTPHCICRAPGYHAFSYATLYLQATLTALKRAHEAEPDIFGEHPVSIYISSTGFAVHNSAAHARCIGMLLNCRVSAQITRGVWPYY